MGTGFSPLFPRKELEHSETASAHGISNTCPESLLANLERISWLAHKAMLILDVPLQVTSGYRCPELNQAIGGSHTSVHTLGLAIDVVPVGLPLDAAWCALTSDPEWMLDVDQLIRERGGNLHIGLPRPGALARHELRQDEWIGTLRTYHLLGHWTPTGVVFI